MSGANPAINFDPGSPSNSSGVENRSIVASPTQPNRAQIPTYAEQIHQIEAQTWEECLRELGQEIARVRQAKGISLLQLHIHTLVPIYHLKALETGNIDKLPEPIYVRGFIRRIGDALELDGKSMAASLLGFDPKQSLLPSWKPSVPSLELLLSPIHFYLGYAVLIVLAVTTLVSLSYQATPTLNSTPVTGNTIKLHKMQGD